MFDSLDEKMKLDDATETTQGERVGKYLLITLCSVLLFSGLRSVSTTLRHHLMEIREHSPRLLSNRLAG